MIGAKKRFEVLKRDGFRCKYCGKNGKDVSLEVDHIISKKQGGNDSMDNLVCCCRECNIGKGSDNIENPAKNLYKQKIDDCSYKVRNYFYSEWNKGFLGSIDKQTATLLVMYVNHHIKDDNIYCTRLTYPPLYGENSPHGKNRRDVKDVDMDIIFKRGEQFCDDILNIMYEEITEQYINSLIEEVMDDSIWIPKNNKHPGKFTNRLNYKLTEDLCEIYEDKKYILSRFTLHPKFLKDE